MFARLAAKIKRSPKKIKREIDKLPILKDKQNKAYQKLLQEHAPLIPKLKEEDTLILEALRKNGTCVIPSANLKIASTDSLLEVGTTLSQELKAMTPEMGQGDYRIDFTKSKLVKHPEIFLWGLSEKLLDLVENYIGLPVIYQGLSLHRDLASTRKVDIRQWHLDWEDRRLVKIIVYLNDVDRDGGPYEYIDRQTTLKGITSLRYYNLGFVSDEKMAQAIPKANWQTCVGQAGTVIITDTSNVFHRAKPIVNNDRFAITFCYTSTKPYAIWDSGTVSQEHWQALDKRISQRQRSCLNIPSFK